MKKYSEFTEEYKDIRDPDRQQRMIKQAKRIKERGNTEDPKHSEKREKINKKEAKVKAARDENTRKQGLAHSNKRKLNSIDSSDSAAVVGQILSNDTDEKISKLEKKRHEKIAPKQQKVNRQRIELENKVKDRKDSYDKKAKKVRRVGSLSPKHAEKYKKDNEFTSEMNKKRGKMKKFDV